MDDVIIKSISDEFGLDGYKYIIEKDKRCVRWHLGNLDNDFLGLVDFYFECDLINYNTHVLRKVYDGDFEIISVLSKFTTSEVSNILKLLDKVIHYA